MDVYGEEYDLSPKEQQEVQQWVESVSDADIEKLQPKSEVGVSEVEKILSCIGTNPDWKSGLKGKPEYVQLYELVHPMGLGMSIKEAAKQLGLKLGTAYHRLKRLKQLNPDQYDLDKWPTKRHLEVYLLVHPQFGGLTQKEVAERFNISQQNVASIVGRVLEKCINAVNFNQLPPVKVFSYDPKRHDGHIKEVF